MWSSSVRRSSLPAVLILVLLVTGVAASSPAEAAFKKSLPSKKQWYAQVSRAMKPAFPYLKRRAASGQKNLAINLDIDNVSLASFYDRKAPIPDTLRLAKLARKLGVKVYFNSGRNAAKLAEVAPLLEAAGFSPSGYCGRYDGESLAISKQRCRQEFVSLGQTIIINVGNNDTDFVGTNYELGIRLPNYGKRLG